jgi:type II secretory pathway pseudopilin PulG
MRQRAVRRAPRGATLIEGLAAAAILLIGLIGVLQALLVASGQNQIASKITRGAAIAQSLRGALETQGFAALNATGGALHLGQCGTDEDALGALAGDLELEPAEPMTFVCLVDLDALEDEDDPDTWLISNYLDDDRQTFRRVAAIYTHDLHPAMRFLGVVVSWQSMGIRMFQKQFFGLYNPEFDPAVGNQTNVEI